MIVTAHIKFSLYTTFLDQMVQAEDERLPGESVEDGVIRVHKELEAAVQKIKDAHQIDLGFGPGIVPMNPEAYRQPDRFMPEAIHQIPSKTSQVIDYKAKEQLEISIDNATTLEEMRNIKEQCWLVGLSKEWITKFNEINNANV
jgi:hypothetical protein